MLLCSSPKWINLEIKQFLFAVYSLTFMRLTWYFLFCLFLIVLPAFLYKILIHARNLYLAMVQEFKIFMHSQNVCTSKKHHSWVFYLFVLIGINLYSYQLMPKIVILNILWFYLIIFYLKNSLRNKHLL